MNQISEMFFFSLFKSKTTIKNSISNSVALINIIGNSFGLILFEWYWSMHHQKMNGRTWNLMPTTCRTKFLSNDKKARSVSRMMNLFILYIYI